MIPNAYFCCTSKLTSGRGQLALVLDRFTSVS